MITTIFSKSTPLNYLLVIGLLILCFFMFQLGITSEASSAIEVVKKLGLLSLLTTSLFITGFVTKRNELSKGSNYSILFFLIFLILFPTVFVDQNLVISSFFVLLAIRRLISLQSLITPKEKIFDACLWIFIASLFHFWSILFILLVFVSIILHVSRDYRNWLLPYIALFAIGGTFILVSMIFDKTLIFQFIESAYIDLKFNYFTNNMQNVALSIYAAFSILFLFSQMISLKNKPLILHSSYKKLIVAFIIGVAVFVISPNKSNDILIYTFMPSSIMATSYIEGLKVKWFKELTAILIVGLCFTCFFLQL